MRFLLYLTTGILLASCSAYKQNIMFQVNDKNALKAKSQLAESNYVIKRNDLLKLEIYTNLGEKIIDPNFESFGQTGTNTHSESTPVYLVDVEGKVKFPMINEINLEGLTMKQAEAILQKEYAKYYLEPFVRLSFTNKRVVVLGAPDGEVVPLANENTRLTEILALSKAITGGAKAHNIRVLRDDKVFVADFSTFEGYLENNIIMLPGDIVYVEPVRRPFSEAIREYGPMLSIITSLGTLVVVLLQIK